MSRAEPMCRPSLDWMYSVERYIDLHERPMTSLNWVDMGVAYSLPSSSNDGGLLAHSMMRSSTSLETSLYSADSSQTCEEGGGSAGQVQHEGEGAAS